MKKMTKRGRSNRNVFLYGSISFLTAWQGLQFAFTREALLTALLAALVGVKAALSQNDSSDEPQDVNVVNPPNDAANVTVQPEPEQDVSLETKEKTNELTS